MTRMMVPANAAALSYGAVDAHGWQRLLSGEGGDVLDLQYTERDGIVAVTRLGLFRSHDGGDHWARIDSPPLARTFHQAGSWWLGTDVGLFRSDHPDESWHLIMPRVAVTDVLASEQSDLVLAATLEEGLLRSEDRGETWGDANPGLPGDDIVAIRRSPDFEHDRTIFVATESGVFRSRNGGRAWRHIGPDVEDIQCFAAGGQQVLVGTYGDGLWESLDGGRTWSQSLPGKAIMGFGTSADGGVLVLSDAGLFTVDGAGHTLMQSAIPPDALCAIDTGTRMLTGTMGHGVLRWMPEEMGWIQASSGLEATVRNRVRVIGNSRLVTTSSVGTMLQSADGGSSWSELVGAPLGAVIDFDAQVGADNGLEGVACDDQSVGVYRGSWHRLKIERAVAVAWLNRQPAVLTADGEFICDQCRSRVIPAGLRLTDAHLYALRERPEVLWSVLYTDSAGIIVLRSPDDGNRWEPLLQTDLSSAVVFSVTIDQRGGEVALLAMRNQVYRLLESPEPVWTGEDALVIAAMAVCEQRGVLLATNQGLLVASHDFATVESVGGSPAPLLDVGIDPAGDGIVVGRGGAIWRFRGTQPVR